MTITNEQAVTMGREIGRSFAETIWTAVCKDREDRSFTFPTDDILQKFGRAIGEAIVNTQPQFQLKDSGPLSFDGGSYTLEGNCRIDVEGVSVYICRRNDGVTVDVYSKGRESEGPIRGTYTSFLEAKREG